MHANVYIPEEFLTHIEAIMPGHLDMASFVASCQKPLRKSIRVNTLKISVEDFRPILLGQITVVTIQVYKGYVITMTSILLA